MKGHTVDVKSGKRCGRDDHIHCERCGQQLDPKKAVWIEWDTSVGGPVKRPVPKEDSQGWFPYGPDCAEVVG